MKKQILKIFVALAFVVGASGCGDSFLDTKYYKGIDLDKGLSTPNNVSTALNGVYHHLFNCYFAGNYAISIGDIPTDITYWNTETGHWSQIYSYNFADTDSYLNYIWEYGYKVADNAARVIKGVPELYGASNEQDKKLLDRCMAEAYALRAYSHLMLVNIFAHQVKVAGTDFSAQPGIVIVKEPIPALTKVSRSSIGDVYNLVVEDWKKSLEHFEAAGGDRGSLFYFNVASVHGLLARTYLYMENWEDAIKSAQEALNVAKITKLTYELAAYKALYNGGDSNKESLFALAISETQNWSANSCGTLWSTYSFSPSPKLLSLYKDDDCRKAIMSWDTNTAPEKPKYAAGKFSHYSSGNSAYGTNYIVNAPEMFLIIAEANLKKKIPDLAAAKTALLAVAKRDAKILSMDNLPGEKEELMKFVKDERARELFQEGLRLYDLRRWDEMTEVYAFGAPQIEFTFKNYKISDLLFPIPSSEINAGFGVEQNDWDKTLPKK